MQNEDQIEYWNGKAGEKWVEHSNLLDGMLAPFASAVMDAAEVSTGERVLDVGCGAGALSLMAAKAVGADGAVTGVDVSVPMLGLARERAKAHAENAHFEDSDASTFQMAAKADVLISRFGVMFFDDPVVAFTNLRSNVAPTGRLAFACWQSLSENEWARAPLEAALPFLTSPPEMPPAGAPGPFAFADPGRVEAVLSAAGWSGVSVMPWTGQMLLPGENPEESAGFMMQLGPAARLIKEQGIDIAPVQAALQERMAEAVTPEGRVAMKASVWIVTANAS